MSDDEISTGLENMRDQIESLTRQRDKAEENYIRVNEENAIQEQEIADLTRENLALKTRMAEMREEAIESSYPNHDSDRTLVGAIAFWGLVVVVVVVFIAWIRR